MMAREADLLARPLLRDEGRHQCPFPIAQVGAVERPGVIAAKPGLTFDERHLFAATGVCQGQRDEPARQAAAHDHVI